MTSIDNIPMPSRLREHIATAPDDWDFTITPVDDVEGCTDAIMVAAGHTDEDRGVAVVFVAAWAKRESTGRWNILLTGDGDTGNVNCVMTDLDGNPLAKRFWYQQRAFYDWTGAPAGEWLDLVDENGWVPLPDVIKARRRKMSISRRISAGLEGVEL